MSEVIKLYENAGVKKYKKSYCDWDSNCPYPYHKCNDKCPYYKYEDNEQYPPFTAEKQLELIKWLAKRENLGCEEKIAISMSKNDYCFISIGLRVLEEEQKTYSDYCYDSKSFEVTLAGLINNLWQDLTDEERKQIKEVLE